MVSIFDGYFGAGSGVMILAVLLVLLDQGLPRVNALKNVVLGLSDLVAAVAFAAFGPLRWAPAGCLAVGLLAGSVVGPSITRRVPARVVRTVVALAGFGLAVRLWVNPA